MVEQLEQVEQTDKIAEGKIGTLLAVETELYTEIAMMLQSIMNEGGWEETGSN